MMFQQLTHLIIVMRTLGMFSFPSNAKIAFLIPLYK